MTNEDALKYFEKRIAGWQSGGQTYNAYETAIEALEKQIAKKVIEKEITYNCPYCDKPLRFNFTMSGGIEGWNFCPHCGQAIDWQAIDWRDEE